jgi:hypothetical protein
MARVFPSSSAWVRVVDMTSNATARRKTVAKIGGSVAEQVSLLFWVGVIIFFV